MTQPNLASRFMAFWQKRELSPLEEAQSTLTDPAILTELLAHSSGRVRRAAARNNSTPTEPVVLMHHVQTGDVAAKADSLEKLSHGNKYLKSLVASHPNTPDHVLEQLALDGFASEVASNSGSPAGLLEFLADPAFGSQLRNLVARNPNASEKLLAAFVKDEHWGTREAVALNPKLSAMALKQLVNDSFWGVREVVAQHPALTSNMVDKLCQDEWSGVREFAAIHPKAAPMTLRNLAETALDDANLNDELLAIAQNANTPPNTLARLVQENATAQIQAAVAAHPSTAQVVLDQLLEHPNPSVRHLAELRSWETTGEDLQKAAKQRNHNQRIVAAFHAKTTPAVLAMLAKDRESQVRAYVAGNPNTPTDALTTLQNDPNWAVRDIAKAVSASESPIPPNVVPSTSPDVRFRRAIAGNPRADLARLEHLAKDHSRGVLLALAGNPKTPQSVLAALAEDEALRLYVVQNPNAPDALHTQIENLNTTAATEATPQAPMALWLRLSNSRERLRVRMAVAANPSAPLSILEALTKDTDAMVRAQLARNPSSSTTVLERLIEDADPNIRILLAQRDKIEANLLERLAKNTDDRIASVIAARQDASPLALNLLASHPKESVHLFVAYNRNTPASALTLLSRSKLSAVRQAVARHHNATPKILEHLGHDWVLTAFQGLRFVWPIENLYHQRIQNRLDLFKVIAAHPQTPDRLLKKFILLRDPGLTATILRRNLSNELRSLIETISTQR